MTTNEALLRLLSAARIVPDMADAVRMWDSATGPRGLGADGWTDAEFLRTLTRVAAQDAKENGYARRLKLR